VPPWRSLRRRITPFDDILSEYGEFLRGHRGDKPSTIALHRRHVVPFLKSLPMRGRAAKQVVRAMSAASIDRFLIRYGATVSSVTLGGVCSSLRSFFRFLHATGRTAVNLAPSVFSPAGRRYARPPRALPWADVRRILAMIDPTTLAGKRDYAMFLMMAAYGMGAGEILDLRLDDFDWQAGTLRVVRPKTSVETLLPLIGPVAKALISYIRSSRHCDRATRRLFVQARVPYRPLSFWGLLRRFHIYAARAKLPAPLPGSHALRHSHASRHLEGGSPLKVVSDILGHRDPSSISTYMRVPTERLRDICLPVPRLRR
jgi:integrase